MTAINEVEDPNALGTAFIREPGETAQTLEDKVDEILSILRPLRPFLEEAPAALAQVGPFIEKIQGNPLIGGFFR